MKFSYLALGLMFLFGATGFIMNITHWLTLDQLPLVGTIGGQDIHLGTLFIIFAFILGPIILLLVKKEIKDQIQHSKDFIKDPRKTYPKGYGHEKQDLGDDKHE